MAILGGRARNAEWRLARTARWALVAAVLAAVGLDPAAPQAAAVAAHPAPEPTAGCVEPPAERYVAKLGATAWLGSPYSGRSVPLEVNAKLRGCRVDQAWFRISAPAIGGRRAAYARVADLAARPTTTQRDYQRLVAAKSAICPPIPLPSAAELLREPERVAGRCVVLRVPLRKVERFVLASDGAGLRLPATLGESGKILLDVPLPGLVEDAERGWRVDETLEVFGHIGVPQTLKEGDKPPVEIPVIEVVAAYDGYRVVSKEPPAPSPTPLPVASNGANGLGGANGAAPSRAPRATPQVAEGDPRVGIAFEDLTESDAAAIGISPPRGAVIQEVDSTSRAAQAGLRPGDVVIEGGGRPVESADDLAQVVDAFGRSPELKLKVIRGGQRLTLTVRRRPVATPRIEDAPRAPAPGEAGAAAAAGAPR